MYAMNMHVIDNAVSKYAKSSGHAGECRLIPAVDESLNSYHCAIIVYINGSWRLYTSFPDRFERMSKDVAKARDKVAKFLKRAPDYAYDVIYVNSTRNGRQCLRFDLLTSGSGIWQFTDIDSSEAADSTFYDDDDEEQLYARLP